VPVAFLVCEVAPVEGTVAVPAPDGAVAED
jgi:hypothetical protein